jgi:hypothetical protein
MAMGINFEEMRTDNCLEISILNWTPMHSWVARDCTWEERPLVISFLYIPLRDDSPAILIIW